jgi:hypothetical protein
MARAFAIIIDDLRVSQRGGRVCLWVREVNLGGGRGGTGLYGWGKSGYRFKRGGGLLYRGRKRQSSFIS